MVEQPPGLHRGEVLAVLERQRQAEGEVGLAAGDEVAPWRIPDQSGPMGGPG